MLTKTFTDFIVRKYILNYAEFSSTAQLQISYVKILLRHTVEILSIKMPQRRDNAGAVCDSGMGMLHQKMG